MADFALLIGTKRSVDRLDVTRRSTEFWASTIYGISGNLLSEQGAELSEHDIESIDMRRIGQHFFQLCRTQKVLPAGANVMRVSCRSVGERFKDSKGGVGEPGAKPGAGTWFLLNAGQNVAQELLHLVALAGLGFKIDVVGFLPQRIVLTTSHPAWVDFEVCV